MQSLLADSIKNEFVGSFPGDHSKTPRQRQTPGVLYCEILPTPVSRPALIGWSEQLGAELGIRKPESEDELGVLAGNSVTAQMRPYAACYAGHQFGNWAGQLGDGRAITLGEWITPAGATQELQLKGAGPTPYSRRADGRAVLRSSVREFLMSEAMHHLGVPTTRALSLVSTGDRVVRDMFYDGHPEPESGAIVIRVAPSLLRFGNFEMLAARREADNLRQLTEWTIDRFYPEVVPGEDRIVRWFREVVRRTAALMVEWMRVGFVHGVMNTDNMSILGLTIDYGPYSFLDHFDPDFTPNTTDLPGRRYAFGRQPSIAKWNLACLAGALSLLLPDPQPLSDALQAYDEDYGSGYYSMMARKLGFDAHGPREADLSNRIQKTLAAVQPDMTLFYQRLIGFSEDVSGADAVMEAFRDTFYKAPEGNAAEEFVATMRDYAQRRRENTMADEAVQEMMRAANPRFVLRNYLLQQAIDELDRGEDTLFKRLQEAILDPYSDRFDDLVGKRPDWAERMAGCSMLSCSS